MSNERNVVVAIFVATVVVWILFDFEFYAFFSTFFNGYPGNYTASLTPPFMATGVAAAFFTIALLVYPVWTKGVRESGVDFK
ncbi:MAG: hypothetical protein M1151_07325 [Candidatus Thermoplasmatota archaeon]|jgi:hypothetical protein|nr:hypothetical protein [Candidatus Thermoplasmatota archaeon]MCL5786454.1 hypothetical protein [Candidatus Thermoplasmatota archaeon]